MSPTEQRLYSASQIAKVGSILRDTSSSTDKMEWALGVLDNFRALHVEPLNVFQNTLRARLKKIGLSDAIMAQRIKRKPTILEKLQRFRSMRLDQMDGIGGICAFVFTLLILSLGQSKFTFFLPIPARNVTFQM